MVQKFEGKFLRYVWVLIGLLLFLTCYYRGVGFHYGISNNLEELPIIHAILGDATFTKDYYVQYHLNNYNQGTPYYYVISFISLLFNLSVRNTFFLVHFLFLSLLYFSLRHFLKSINEGMSEGVVLFGATSLLWITNIQQFGGVIPNARIVFFPFLDPEFMVYPVAMFCLSYYLRGKLKIYAWLLFITTVIHPLYGALIAAVILIHTLIINRAQLVKLALNSSLAVLPYTIYVWWVSRLNEESIFEPSMIGEFVRAPHHFFIPQISDMSGATFRFYTFTGLIAILSSLLIAFLKNKSFNERANKTIYLTWIIIFGLYLVSIISVFGRFSLLIELTPYRIGSFAVVMSWLLLVTVFFKFCYSKSVKIGNSCLAGLLLLAAWGFYRAPNVVYSSTLDTQTALSDWIKVNTSEDSLFLNYTGLDVRTQALRSDYYTFKNYPLTAGAQIEWYKQTYVYQDLDSDEVEILDYKAVKKAISTTHLININNVLEKIDQPIDYVLTNTDDQNIEIRNLEPVYINANYTVWRVDP